MGRNIESIKAFLEEHEWPFGEADGRIWGHICGENGKWGWCFFTDDDDTFLAFHSSVPVRVPRARRLAVAEYVARANLTIRVGSFDLDLSDGELAFRVAMPTDPETPVSQKVINDMVYGNFGQVDFHLPWLLAVAYGRLSPRAAIDRSRGRKRRKARKKRPPAPDIHRRHLLEGLN